MTRGFNLETKFKSTKCVQAIDPFGNRIRFNEVLKQGGHEIECR